MTSIMRRRIGAQSRHSHISAAWITFMKFYACFAVFTCFSNTYIITFLKRATGSDTQTMLYNLSQLAVQPFAMIAAVYLIRKKSPLYSQRIGLIMYAAVFAAFCAFGEAVSHYHLLVGSVISAANGFYFVTYVLQVWSYATDQNRDESYGLQSLLSGVIGLTLPILSGYLVAGFDTFLGYRILFGVGLLASALSVYFSTKLDPVGNVTPQAHVGQALRVLLTERHARAAMLSATVTGFYSGAITFFVTLLLYSAAGSERTVGLTNTLANIITIVASGVYMRLVRPENRTRAIVLGLSALILAAAPLLARVSVGTLMLFSLAQAALSCFIFNSALTAYFGVIERIPALDGLGGEVHALREFFLKVGQITGTLITIVFADVQGGAAVVIILILLTQYLNVYFCRVMAEIPARPEKG